MANQAKTSTKAISERSSQPYTQPAHVAASALGLPPQTFCLDHLNHITGSLHLKSVRRKRSACTSDMEHLPMNTYTIYTDGACTNNGKPNARAGWGAVMTNPQGDTLELAGPVPEAQEQTNSRAELLALVEALERCTQPAPITLHTDSEYIANACNGHLEAWKAKGWRKSDKKQPKHLDLWQRLDQLLQEKDVTVRWLRGHNGTLGNERADALATLGATGKTLRKRTKRLNEADKS
jgi:ribonuclease HI